VTLHQYPAEVAQKPLNQPSRPSVGRVNCTVPIEMVEWIDSHAERGYTKTDIVAAGLALVYLLEHHGEIPDWFSRWRFKPWDGDSLADECPSRSRPRSRKKKKKAKPSRASSLSSTKTKPAVTHEDFEGDCFDWDE